MKRMLGVVVSILFVLMVMTWVSAAERGEMAAGKEPTQDRKFVTGAAWGGMFEVEAGKLAEKSSNADVKRFGQKMVADHTKANEELMSIAQKRGLVPPQGMGKDYQSELDKLQKKSGDDFDKTYMERMVKDHKDTISLFEKEVKDGKDEEIKAFASKTLPVLKEHLQMAQDTENKVKGKK